ncbi:hypothetical protein B0H17DRAFT_1038119, partial [Mycena rosella]
MVRSIFTGVSNSHSIVEVSISPRAALARDWLHQSSWCIIPETGTVHVICVGVRCHWMNDPRRAYIYILCDSHALQFPRTIRDSILFFRFYDQPGFHLPVDKQAELRKELLQMAHASLDPVPNYQCLSSVPDALDDKIIESSDAYPPPCRIHVRRLPRRSRPRACIIHTGLTVAVPSLQRTGILMQLFVQLFQHVMALHPHGMWATALAAVLSSLVQSEKVLYNAHPCLPYRLQKQRRGALEERRLQESR